MPSAGKVTNALLAAAPTSERMRLLAHCTPCELAFGDVVYETGAAIKQVFFPIDAVISLLTEVEGHHAIEVGMIGREGIAGIPLVLGARTSPVRAFVQGAGAALRMPAHIFLEEVSKRPTFRREVLRFAHASMMQVAQSAACHRFHQLDARLARWLLMMRDRAGTLDFSFTHRFLANILGVRREGATQVASQLQQRGLIEIGRGHLSVLDEDGLEAAACSCYATMRVGAHRRAPAGRIATSVAITEADTSGR